MFKQLMRLSVAVAIILMVGCASYSRYTNEINLVEKRSAAVLPKREKNGFGNFFNLWPMDGEIYPAGLATMRVEVHMLQSVFQTPRSAIFKMQCNLEAGKIYGLEGAVENDRVRVWIVERSTNLVVSKVYVADLEQGPVVATELPILKKK